MRADSQKKLVKRTPRKKEGKIIYRDFDKAFDAWVARRGLRHSMDFKFIGAGKGISKEKEQE